ncbi:hypothetical protein V3481_000115 [Fusarium oxysporum f. sp. vasinfectum]
MPLQSKRTVKVHEIPTGTSEAQYLAFVEHLCTKPQKTSRFRLSRVTKHFKGKSKSDASTSASTDEVDEDVKSKDEADLTGLVDFFPVTTLTTWLGHQLEGRLRMSVDHAIDSFIFFSNSVFGHPRLFHVTSAYFHLRAKYSAVKAFEAFKSIITRKFLHTLRDALSLKSTALRATFADAGGGTRT